MNKTLTIFATLLMVASMAKAETNDVIENTDPINSTFNISTAETDMQMLENKAPLLPAPQAGADKDAAYWGQAVLSRVKVLGYAQAGYTATFNEAEGAKNSNTFDMKRAVLMLAADIAPKFFGFFMYEFKSGTVQEYYMEYRPCKAMNFRLGQSKNELTMANVLSPRVLESINCSPQSVGWLCGADPLMSNGSGRDLGLMMYGDLFQNKFHYAVEVVNGGQINKNDQNTQKNVIGKLEYKPMSNLRLSVSGQLGHGYAVTASPYNTSVVAGQTYCQNRYAGGFEWMSSAKGSDWYKNRCAIVRCEALGGRDGDVNSFGAYGAATVPVYKQWDVVAQADYFNYNTDKGYKQTNLTAGIQYWVHTKNRVQLQYTYSLLSDAMKTIPGKAGNYGQLMAQVQFSF